MTMIEEAAGCRWCGSRTEPFPAPRGAPQLPRYRCSGCGTIAYREAPDGAALADFYQQGWSDDDAYFTGVTATNLAQSLLNALVGNNRLLGKVLDFGAGKGAFSEVLARRDGTQVTAVEPYGPTVNLPGVTWLGSLDEAATHGPYDTIFLIEVIEHFPDPVAVMAQVREWLTPAGTIYLSTPNARGLTARRQRERWREAQNPTHINLFSHQSLSRCLSRAGLTAFNRSHRPVSYGKALPSRALLTLTQLLGIDGGLRGSVGRAGG